VRRLVAAIVFGVTCCLPLPQTAAFAGQVHPGCAGSGCSVGTDGPGGPGSDQTASSPNPNADSGPSSGPCPPGQIPLYGFWPARTLLGDLDPVTGAPIRPGTELEDIYCNGNYLTTVMVPPSAPAGSHGPRITGAELARRAFAGFAVSLPVPVLSPSTAVVNYPTWLWLAGGWLSRSATASVPGLSATVTAAPTRVVWTMGDGGQAVCDGPGVAWNVAVPNDSTYCSYTYQTAGTFTATVTVYYGATWSASDGTAGALGVVTGRAAFPVTVDEIEAVNN
jgi:hypothetical protein